MLEQQPITQMMNTNSFQPGSHLLGYFVVYFGLSIVSLVTLLNNLAGNQLEEPKEEEPEVIVEECAICLCEIEAEEEVVLLDCQHQYHKECISNQINAGAGTEHLTFQYVCCALCRSMINHAELESLVAPIKELKDATDALALSIIADEGVSLFSDEIEHQRFHTLSTSEQLQFAYHKLTFYQCSECNKPYYGGKVSCGEAMEMHDNEKKESTQKTCTSCSASKICEHDVQNLTFKCVKCCDEATYYCQGTDFYCDRCHGDLYTLYPCPGGDACTLGFPHPENKLGSHGGGGQTEPFVIRCAICGPRVNRPAPSIDQCNVVLY